MDTAILASIITALGAVIAVVLGWWLTHKPGKNIIKPRSIIPFSNSDTFGPIFDQVLKSVDAVVMVGTGLSILHDDLRRQSLIQRIKEGCKVEIYAANPFSPHVETRLIEEETGDTRPLISQHGLRRWLKDLVIQKEKLGNQFSFSLKLFPYYPTIAFFIFTKGETKTYFFYPYGYARLGTFSPVLLFTNEKTADQSMLDFLDEQYDRIKQVSSDAKLVLDLHESTLSMQEANQMRTKLLAFAVYLIPAQDTELYQYGSDVLGYDVRGKRFQPTMWGDKVGAAADYGFHLTVADALYCVNEHDILLIAEEVQYVALDFRPFRLTLHLEKDFPNSNSIAIACDDHTGSLEALHHEMVARIYRKAVASNYTFDPTLADRDSDTARRDLMIKRYHAPYIINKFKPHFSLLSNVPARIMDNTLNEVNGLYKKQIHSSFIDINSIVIMRRFGTNKHWEIFREYKLGE